MSILRVDKILSYLEEEEVHVLGLRVGDFPIQMDIDTETFVKDGTCVYQNDKFRFKQDGRWLTLGGDGTFSLDFKTDGGGTITVGVGDAIALSGESSTIRTYPTVDADGDPTLGIAWRAGLNQLSVDSPGDTPSGHPGNVRSDLSPVLGDIFQWNPHGDGVGIGHWDAIGAGDGVSSGDVLTWNGTEWSASPVPITGDVFSVLDGTPISRQIAVITDDTCKEITNSLAAIDISGNISSPGRIQGNVLQSSTATITNTLQVSNAPVIGHVLTCTNEETGSAEWQAPSGGGGGADNLGDHTATENLMMDSFNVVFGLTSPVSDPSISRNSDNGLNVKTNGTRRIEVTQGGKIGFGVWSDLDGDGLAVANIASYATGPSYGLYIDHGGSAEGLYIKQAEEDRYAADMFSTGRGLRVRREDESDNALIDIIDENSLSTGTAMHLVTAGTSNAILAESDSSLPTVRILNDTLEGVVLRAGGPGALVGDPDDVVFDVLRPSNSIPVGGKAELSRNCIAIDCDGRAPRTTIDIKNHGGFGTSGFYTDTAGDTTPVAKFEHAHYRAFTCFITTKDDSVVPAEYTSVTVHVIHDGTTAHHVEYGRLETGAGSTNTNPVTFSTHFDAVSGWITLRMNSAGLTDGTAVVSSLQGDLRDV